MTARLILALMCALGTQPAAAEPFVVSMPRVEAATVPSSFEISMPAVTVHVQPSSFVISLPTVEAVILQSAFVVTLPEVTARSFASGFTITMPDVTAAVDREPEEAPEDAVTPDASTTDLACAGLLQCFEETKVRAVEDGLMRQGLEPSNTFFCGAVADELGSCTPDIDPAQETAAAGPFAPSLGVDVDGGLFMARCPPFEEYMIELEERRNAGEDVTAESERLALSMQSAQAMLLDGRSDLWCAAITAGIP